MLGVPRVITSIRFRQLIQHEGTRAASIRSIYAPSRPLSESRQNRQDADRSSVASNEGFMLAFHHFVEFSDVSDGIFRLNTKVIFKLCHTKCQGLLLLYAKIVTAKLEARQTVLFYYFAHDSLSFSLPAQDLPLSQIFPTII